MRHFAATSGGDQGPEIGIDHREEQGEGVLERLGSGLRRGLGELSFEVVPGRAGAGKELAAEVLERGTRREGRCRGGATKRARKGPDVEPSREDDGIASVGPCGTKLVHEPRVGNREWRGIVFGVEGELPVERIDLTGVFDRLQEGAPSGMEGARQRAELDEVHLLIVVDRDLEIETVGKAGPPGLEVPEERTKLFLGRGFGPGVEGTGKPRGRAACQGIMGRIVGFYVGDRVGRIGNRDQPAQRHVMLEDHPVLRRSRPAIHAKPGISTLGLDTRERVLHGLEGVETADREAKARRTGVLLVLPLQSGAGDERAAFEQGLDFGSHRCIQSCSQWNDHAGGDGQTRGRACSQVAGFGRPSRMGAVVEVHP